MCELAYGTTPSLLDPSGPTPHFPITEWKTTPGATGSPAIAVRSGLSGASSSTLDGSPSRKPAVKKPGPFAASIA